MRHNTRQQIRFHFIFWLVYILLWGTRDLIYHPNWIGNVILYVGFSILVAPFIYFHLLYLVPRYLFRRRWTGYTLLLLFNFGLMVIVRYYGYQFTFRTLLSATETAERFASLDGLVIVISENLILLVLTMALYLIQEWYAKDRYAQELEKKNMESELNLLKAQLQPHFLFNNLNTIYFLMETNPSQAREVMVQFSDVLSHQLYNANKDRIPLKEELSSLKSYLQLQQLRNEDFLDLKYSFPDETHDLEIAPMILLTFIENALKHSQKEAGYFINLRLELKGGDLQMNVINSIGTKNGDEPGGVGLENVKKRLNLIYPDRHSLKIDKTEDVYEVDLTLTLDKHGEAELHSH